MFLGNTRNISCVHYTDSYPVAFRRRKRGDAGDSGKKMRSAQKGYGKDEVFHTILCMPLKATGYESVRYMYPSLATVGDMSIACNLATTAQIQPQSDSRTNHNRQKK